MNHNINLDTRQLLTAFQQHLNLQFFAMTRAEAKTFYNSLIEEGRASFMVIDLSDGSEINCDLELDHSDYSGKLNFGKFRQSLASLLLALDDKLKSEEDINVMSSDNGDLLFNELGVTETEDGLNVLASGMRQEARGQLTLQLMFLHPQQFDVSN